MAMLVMVLRTVVVKIKERIEEREWGFGVLKLRGSGLVERVSLGENESKMTLIYISI